MNYRRFLPNLCTAMNLVFGMCSILSTVQGSLDWGAIFIFLALIADGLDGRTARFFGVSSEFGKEMDSLCDLGSFGVAPAILAWTLALHNYGFFGIAGVRIGGNFGVIRMSVFATTQPFAIHQRAKGEGFGRLHLQGVAVGGQRRFRWQFGAHLCKQGDIALHQRNANHTL